MNKKLPDVVLSDSLHSKAAGAIRLCFERASRELLPRYLADLDIGDLDELDEAAEHLRDALNKAMSLKARNA